MSRAKYDPSTDTYYPASSAVEWGIFRDNGYGRESCTRDYYPWGTTDISYGASHVSYVDVVEKDEPVSVSRDELIELIYREDFSRPIFGGENATLQCYERELVATQLLMFYPPVTGKVDHRLTPIATTLRQRQLMRREQLVLARSAMDVVMRATGITSGVEVVYGE